MWKKLLFPFAIVWIISSVHSADVTCQWNRDICTITSITPVTQQNETINVVGKADDYVNNWGTTVFFNSTILKYVPTRLFYRFIFIRSFTMLNTFTTNLVTDAFVNCQYFYHLGIQDVNIANVPAGFAQSCSDVKTLMLINAGIQTIDVDAFKGMTKIEVLYLRDNKIACLPPDVFQNSPLIGDLDLNNNKLIAVDAGIFRNLPRLHVINLSKNLLTYLPLFDVTGSGVLNGNLAFFLSGNPVNAIQPSFCDFFGPSRVGIADMFDVPGFKCLPNTAQTVTIMMSNCRTTMDKYLQVCYSNWTTSMSTSVPCSPSACASFMWQQFLDFMKTRA